MKLIYGDCMDHMRGLAVDAIVTLPPVVVPGWGQDRLRALLDAWLVAAKSLTPNLVYWRGEDLTGSRIDPAWSVVLDPFMGFGDVGVACHERGIDFIGIEIDAERFAHATQRLEALWQQE